MAEKKVALSFPMEPSGENKVVAALEGIRREAEKTNKALEGLGESKAKASDADGQATGGLMNFGGALTAVASTASGLYKGLILVGEGLSKAIGFGAQVAGAALHLLLVPLESLWRLLEQTARWAAIAGVGLATAFGYSTLRNFSEYQAAITNSATVTGLLGRELEGAKRQLFDFGLAQSLVSRQTPTQIAGLFYGLGSAGLNVPQQMAVAPSIIALGEATSTEPLQVSEQVMATLSNFGLQRDRQSTERIANLYAAAIGSSPFTMQRLQYFMQYAGPLAASAGLSPERSVAMGGVLMQRGLPAEMAGTGFRQIVNQLLTPGGPQEEVLGALGLDPQAIAQQVSRGGLLQVLDTLKQRGIDLASVFKLFGAEAGNAANILINAGAPAVLGLEKQLTGTNRAFEMQSEQLKPVDGLWAVLKSTVQGLEIQFGRGLEPTLTRVLERLNEVTGGWFKSGFMERMGAGVGDLLGGIIDRVEAWASGGGLEKLWDGLVSGAQKAWGFLSNLYSAVKEWFRPEMIQWYGQVWQWLKGVLGDAADALGEKLGLKGGGFFETLAHLPELIGRGVRWLQEQAPNMLMALKMVMDPMIALTGSVLGLAEGLAMLVLEWNLAKLAINEYGLAAAKLMEMGLFGTPLQIEAMALGYSKTRQQDVLQSKAEVARSMGWYDRMYGLNDQLSQWYYGYQGAMSGADRALRGMPAIPLPGEEQLQGMTPSERVDAARRGGRVGQASPTSGSVTGRLIVEGMSRALVEWTREQQHAPAYV